MSNEHRRCNQCGFHVEADAVSCRQCGGNVLIWVSGPAVADLRAPYQPVQVPRPLFSEEPMVRCAFCGQHTEAAKAHHSRYDGRGVCWPCKQAEEVHV